MRDSASIVELLVLRNIESMNAEMINDGIEKKERFSKLLEVASRQTKRLVDADAFKSIKRTSGDVYLPENKTDN